MVGVCPRDRAARGHLARLVAVVAVLTGLVLLQGPRCVDGMIDMTGGMNVADMTVDMTVDMNVGMTVDMGPGVATGPAAHSSPTMLAAVGGGRGADDPRGVLAACLVFLVVVLVAFVGLRRPRALASVAAPRAPAGPAIADGWPVRSPGLARLGVLRI